MAAIPKDPQVCIHPQETQSFWNGARLPFRYRRRVTLLVLAISLSAIALLLYSSNHLLDEKYLHPLSQLQACQSLDAQKPCVPELQVDSPPLTVTITSPSKTDTVIVKPPVQPVVFSLVMVSEQSAKEGVILLKVR